MKKAIYKILRSEGVSIKAKSAHYISYLGKSYGYPVFAVDYDDVYWSGSSYELLRSGLIVNTKPGYLLMACEVVPIPDGVNPFIEPNGISQSRPMSAPTGLLYYMDYVYGSTEFDERLLLMM